MSHVDCIWLETKSYNYAFVGGETLWGEEGNKRES